MIDTILLAQELGRLDKVGIYSPNQLNEYQNNANLTAIYPGRLGKCTGLNGKLLEYLTKNWASFDSFTEGKGLEIKSLLESGTPFMGLFYVSLGLSGEMGEMQEKIMACDDKDSIVGEIGDVYWYISQVCMELNTPMGYLLNITPSYKTARKIIHDPELIKYALLLTCSVWTGRVSEITKKLLRDSQGHLSPIKKTMILENLTKILIAMRSICALQDVTPEFCMEKNIEKLFSRKERGKIGGSGDNR